MERTPEERADPNFWYTKMAPNGRSPVLIDHHQKDHIVWESSAIIHYLVSLYDHSHSLYPESVFEQSQVNQWENLQTTTMGPMIGQAFWFGYWHDEALMSAYKRYVDETKRILRVLERFLQGKEWLVGGKMSIADVSFLAWYEEAFMVDVDIEKEFPRVHAWLESMRKIPEIVQGSVGREMIQPKKIWEREGAE
jgi:glutathione S-transferase